MRPFCYMCNSYDCRHIGMMSRAVMTAPIMPPLPPLPVESGPSIPTPTEDGKVISLADEAFKRGDIQAPFKYESGYGIGLVRMFNNMRIEHGERETLQMVANVLESMGFVGRVSIE